MSRRPARGRSPLGSLATDLSPLRESRDFRLLFSGQLVSMVGRQITVVAVPYQVFQITRSPLDVGLLGLVQVGPLVVFSLLGGAIADMVDRRRLLLATNALLALCSTAYAVAALRGSATLAFLYSVAAVAAALSVVDQPARSATVPNLVRRDQLTAALALMFAVFQVTLIAGPAAGGVIIGRFGLGVAYLVDVVTFGAAIAAVAAIAPQPPHGARREPPLRAIRSGLRFAWSQKPIVAGFAVDLDAMIFGMPRALFPVLAEGTFHAGPGGLGLLYAAPGAGAVCAALLTGPVARAARQGVVILVAVAMWGTGCALFGLTSHLWVGLVCLAVAGAADSVSAVCRSTMMQTLTPDPLRGRMSATYSMVVVGGPYIGDVEAGAVASAFTPRVSVVSGGLLCVAGAVAVAALFPALARYRPPGVREVPAGAVEPLTPGAAVEPGDVSAGPA